MYSNFSGKNAAILLTNPAFRERQILLEWIFWGFFSIQYIHIKIIFKTVSHFSYFSAVLEKSELSFNQILKECLISKDLQIISVWSAFIRVAPLEILKRYCNASRTWSSPSTTRYNDLTKQDSNFITPVSCFNVLWYIIIWFFTRLIFWLPLLNKWSEAAIQSLPDKFH